MSLAGKSETDAKPEFWQPTRPQLAKWHLKNHLGAAALFGIMALAVILYLAAMTILSRHLPRWMP
jgi:hypothetical protein